MDFRDVLDGVVALVVCSDPSWTAKPAIQRTLVQMGAKVVTRLSKEVTHIIYERRQLQQQQRARAGGSRESEQELQELYSKTDKLDPRPTIVSPSWVEESRTARRRLVERKFLIARPKEALLAKPTGRTPGSGVGHGKKRKAAAPPPKPLDTLELGELITSSQQIAGDVSDKGADAGHNVSSPRLGKQGCKRVKLSEPAGATAGKAAKHTAGAATGRAEGSTPGNDTQQVADIMLGDLLGGGGQADTPGLDVVQDKGWEDDSDDLDTPLGIRLAKSTSRSASKEGERRYSGLPPRRSRLAQASGPHADVAVDVQHGEVEDEEQQEQEQEVAPPKGTTANLQPAQRYSVRQLTRMEEKPLKLHKGTPLPGTQPPPTDAKRRKQPIPVPMVERVTSPWADAEQLPSQSQSQHSQPPAGRDSGQGPQQLQHPHRRKSLLHGGVRNDASPASVFKPPGPAAGTAPWSTQRPWDGHRAPPQPASSHPVTALQRDGSTEEAAAAPVGVLRENVGAAVANQQAQLAAQGAPPKQKHTAGSIAEDPGEGQRARNQEAQRQRRWQRGADEAAAAAAIGAPAAAAEVPELDEVEGLGPLHGVIALTSVDPGVVDLCKSAVRRLRGLRLCSEGHEHGKITHLVIGKERRTLKLMLAVANGAWLVTPEWVTASLEAGRWLPEGQYLAKVRFVSAAEKARCQLEVPDMPALLADYSIYFHLKEGSSSGRNGGCNSKAHAAGSNVTALKRVALALGAKVVPPKSCTVCVVVGRGSRPTCLPKGAAAVKEEWLLMAAERFEVPSTSSKEFALR